MNAAFLDLLRCPFCGMRLLLEDNAALVRSGDDITSGVVACGCCAFPIVAGIPVFVADDRTRDAMHTLEAGHRDEALVQLLGLDPDRARAFHALNSGDQRSYRALLEILSLDAEGTYFVYHFSDPTYMMCDALVRAIGQDPRAMGGRVLDLCGGSGHLTRPLVQLRPAGGVVLSDLYFWKLWLATTFTSPGCTAVCCDANSPLPFAGDSFSLVLLADAFPYIWHKRMLADEMMRLSGPDGIVVMPHLHSSLGENFSAGDTLTPEGYANLFERQGARLFSDIRLFEEVFRERRVDLTRQATPGELGDEPSVTLVATRRASLFRRYEVPEAFNVSGELRVNPLYRVELRNGSSALTLTFPTPEYEEEFGGCKQYLPETLTLKGDLSGRVTRETIGADYEELRRRRVILDVPVGYL